ncbi:MAG: glycosyltransferase family 4 protein [Actinomycetota bacterium]|nr:glycosyltransferase family 4 protein [Actinomycetota bacterium]
MSGVLLVDWLGRGGIAQATACWAAELQRAGRTVQVVTRGGRELSDLVGGVVGAGDGERHVAAHRAVVREAVEVIRSQRPAVVVVQNYVLPSLERPVYGAAAAVGARLVVVVHDHRLHTLLAGNRVGLRGNLRRADVVAAHSAFVARSLRGVSPHPVHVLPLSLHDVLFTPHPAPRRPGPGADRSAIHFGILRRRYKGTGLVAQLAGDGVPGWRFTLVGAGAPARLPGAVTVSRFTEAGELLQLVGNADAAVLPYSMATQSGAVALAQALGTVPVASAVGGIPEQIVDGETGRLVPAGAGPDAWRAVLEDLATDPARLQEMAGRARAHARAAHDRFRTEVVALTA